MYGHYVAFLVAFLNVCTRFKEIEKPNYVCWDEAHFGKMAGYYLNNTYFLDVNPPFGKLFIALIGWTQGYKGQFNFEAGNSYFSKDNATMFAPYIPMRAGCASFGVFTTIIVFFIVQMQTGSFSAALFAFIFLSFDLSLIISSRFILLDSILLFFIFASVLCHCKVSSCHDIQGNQDRNFCFLFWFYLLLTGLFLGFALSTKFVGLFTIVLLGLYSTNELWSQLPAFSKYGFNYYFKHILSKFIFLLFIPFFVYVSSFYIHFSLLVKSGPGSLFHSSKFQMDLIGNPLHKQTTASIPSDFLILIRSNTLSRVYLHSQNFINMTTNIHHLSIHQVTTNILRDSYKVWKIKFNHFDKENKKILSDGQEIILEHFLSSKHLTLIDDQLHLWKSAPISAWNLMVGTTNNGNADKWKVKIINTCKSIKKNVITILSHIQLYNGHADCHLCNTNNLIPSLENEQFEVVCSKQLHSNCVWYIESLSSNLSSEVTAGTSLSFWEKFIETQVTMLYLNSKLVKYPGDRAVHPWKWPFNSKPSLYSKVKDSIYFIGTPALWWINLLSLIGFPFFYLFTTVSEGRNKKHLSEYEYCFCNKQTVYESSISKVRKSVTFFFIGWLLHYFPFFLMSRVLFFHHYLPSHIFASMLSATFIDFIIYELSSLLYKKLSVPAHVIRLFFCSLICLTVMLNCYLIYPF